MARYYRLAGDDSIAQGLFSAVAAIRRQIERLAGGFSWGEIGYALHDMAFFRSLAVYGGLRAAS